jgi:hypothetical protein
MFRRPLLLIILVLLGALLVGLLALSAFPARRRAESGGARAAE